MAFRRNLFLPTISVISLVIALAYIVYKFPQLNLRRTSADVPAAKLFFQPGQISIPAATSQFTVDVHMDNAGRAIGGADVLVEFDKNVLTLNTISPNLSHAVFKTFVPVTASNVFDSARVVQTANSSGVAEFGFVSFNLANNTITQPTAQNSAFNPIAMLNFTVKSGITRPANTTLRFKFTASRNSTDSNIVLNANPPEDILLDPSYANATSVITFVPTPTLTPTTAPTATPTTAPTNGNLAFNLKFQGVSSQKPSKQVRLILKQGATERFNQNITMTANASGIYSGTATGIAAGTYDAYLKGPAHLQKKLTGIVITASSTNWPTSNPPTLLAGDISNDNFVDISDYSLLANLYNPTIQQTSNADLDFDGLVDISDYSLMIINYRPGVSGD